MDAEDADVPLARMINELCVAVWRYVRSRIDPFIMRSGNPRAIRGNRSNTWRSGMWQGPVPKDWKAFAEAGFLPDASGMQYVFRAITPPGRPRRFDARFFFVDADLLQSDLDDFSAASEELSHLQWILGSCANMIFPSSQRWFWLKLVRV